MATSSYFATGATFAYTNTATASALLTKATGTVCPARYLFILSVSCLNRTMHLVDFVLNTYFFQENLKPKCYLCGQYGGSMKRATNGEWVHIQCALWIPEVTMGDPEKMSNPNVNAIPETRRALKCHICQGGIGCIQVREFQRITFIND